MVAAVTRPTHPLPHWLCLGSSLRRKRALNAASAANTQGVHSSNTPAHPRPPIQPSHHKGKRRNKMTRLLFCIATILALTAEANAQNSYFGPKRRTQSLFGKPTYHSRIHVRSHDREGCTPRCAKTGASATNQKERTMTSDSISLPRSWPSASLTRSRLYWSIA
jgi:hypothetical protein